MEARDLALYLYDHLNDKGLKGIEKLQASPGVNPTLHITVGGKRFLIRVFALPESAGEYADADEGWASEGGPHGEQPGLRP